MGFGKKNSAEYFLCEYKRRLQIQYKKLIFIIVCLTPVFCSAEIWITEVQYNPEGSDGGFEWIEIWNNGGQDADISGFKLRENNINHGLKESMGDLVLDDGEYAVIADNPDKFKTQFPDYAGTIIDSAFSLSNSGELLQLTEPGGVVIFEMTYNNNYGNGNGYSLGLLDDIWSETYTSPGQINSPAPLTPEPDQENNQPEVAAEQAPSDGTNTPTLTSDMVEVLPATYIEIRNPQYSEKLIKIDAMGDRTVMAGVEYWFEGKLYGLQGGIIDEPNIRWNWGDGTTSFGTPAAHRYKYPGIYTVTLSGSVSKYSTRDRFQVTVIDPALELQFDPNSGLIHLHNTSTYTLEISGYQLINQEHSFTFPADSFINAGQRLVLDETIIGLTDSSNTITFTDHDSNPITEIDLSIALMKTIISEIQTSTHTQVSIADVASSDRGSQEITTAPQSGLPTHSTVYVYPSDTVEGSWSISRDTDTNFVPVDVPQEPGPAEITSFRQLQQAQIAGALADENKNTHNIFFMIALVIALVVTGCLYLCARIVEHKSRSGVEIVD